MRKAEDENSAAEIVIYDAIGKSFWDDDAVSAKQFIDALAEMGETKNITLRVNSPGGDVFDGVAIYNAIKNHKAKVTAHIDGIAASAASYIVMAADKIVMPSNAFMLIHQASGFSMGNAEDMLAIAADLQRLDKSITSTYAARTGQKPAKVAALMKEDRLMDAEEAKSLGYADEITAPVKMAATYKATTAKRLMPEAAAARLIAETGDGQGDPPLSDPEPQKPVDQPEVSSASPTPEPQPAPPAPPAPPQEHPAPGSPQEVPPATRPSPPDAPPTPGTPRNEAEDLRTYIASVTDLCTLASAPERVGAYLKANTPVDQVRKELLEAKASGAVLSQHPLAVHGGPQPSAWGKITDKINARQKK
jgi:ATP-dependent Clp endopeptidase proteolytic subunit ClpP